jgi:hypothetical protein
MVLKWEESIRKWEVIAPTRPDSRKPRKSHANPNTAPIKSSASNRDRNAQEGCRNGGAVLILVFAVEQVFQFFL